MLVTDNETAFTSIKFTQFVKQNGIRHVTYHPALNGLAEHAVKTFKGMTSNGSLETKFSRFLFKYRLTPQSTTGVSPQSLCLGDH